MVVLEDGKERWLRVMTVGGWGGGAHPVRGLHCIAWWCFGGHILSVLFHLGLFFFSSVARGAYHCIALGVIFASLVCGYTDRGYPFAIYYICIVLRVPSYGAVWCGLVWCGVVRSVKSDSRGRLAPSSFLYCRTYVHTPQPNPPSFYAIDMVCLTSMTPTASIGRGVIVPDL